MSLVKTYIDIGSISHEYRGGVNVYRTLPNEAATFHHDPVKALREPMPAATAHAADLIVHSMRLGSSGGVLRRLEL